MQKSELLPPRRTILVALMLLALALSLGVVSLMYKPDSMTGSGIARVGGPFTMINHRGETVTEKSFAGKFMLVFFGFTYCPDVCPTELQVMTTALNTMGTMTDRITPVFVSIDPERDTVDVVANYISNFHPRLVGLTGSQAQVASMAKAYRVYYAKVENKERPQDYQMDHSAIIYLMGPDGKFLKHFTYTTDPAAIRDTLVQVVENYK